MRLFIFMVTCILHQTVLSQCRSGDCQNGRGKYDYGYAVYEGEFKNGQPHGKGVMDYGGGEKFEGQFVNGKEDGEGKLYKKGVAIVVTYRLGVLQQKQTAPVVIGGNGDWKKKVEGCITGDCTDGYGEIVFPSGNRYKGYFKNNQFDGQGEMRFADGNVLKANFIGHEPQSGSFFYAENNTLFTGTFNADGTPRSGTYTNAQLDGVVEVRNGSIISERHPRRDSINKAASAAEADRIAHTCSACEGKGEYLKTSWTPMISTRSEMTATDGYSGGLKTYVTYKSSGGFSQKMQKCPVCKGTGRKKN